MTEKFIKRSICVVYLLFFCFATFAQQQPQKLWHNKEREIHYYPDGGDIVIVNGKHRFNRAIYGTNTAFRVEAGDLPEFALYLPGMGGNLRFGLIDGNSSKWIIDAATIEARYRPGSMIYTIHDPILGEGELLLTVLAGAVTESMIVKAEFKNVDHKIDLFWAFGGVTGKKFSRDGDLGADPESSFYLKTENCTGNSYKVTGNNFVLNFAGKVTNEADRYEIKQPGATDKTVTTVETKEMNGTFPVGMKTLVGDFDPASPVAFNKQNSTATPAISGQIHTYNEKPYYFLIQSPAEKRVVAYAELPGLFASAEASRKKIASQVVINTPDPYINTLGGALSIAADAIWESPSYMHGAVAWRMRLNAWRGPYVADVLGWHDRARSHFSSYALSQMTSPESGPNVPDTAMHLARQQEKLGNAMFSEGYISRNPGGKIVPHHYDMNIVTIDAMLNHFYWTGDLDYVKKMWPVLTRDLAWEKRNFDADGDGLYDAYCAIWASDALQYSGGGVTHSSAYNYRANKDAAYLAKLIGEDPTPYQKEADHILAAVNKTLWMPKTGQYAEYQDLLGEKLIHPAAALWTVYHAIDEGIADNFQAYQALRYVDTQIPHIPIIAKGVPEGFYTLSTTNWMPYDWSLNNVVLAEELHTSLAYWQAGRAEDAFKLWKGSLLESMFLENSPGNFDQLSFYDSTRGELYRDFGDPIGMAGRSLVEGLFGIHPNALEGTLTIKPGFPVAWDHASIQTPDIKLEFKESQPNYTKETVIQSYTVNPNFAKNMDLVLELSPITSGVVSVTVNGKSTHWKSLESAVGSPILQIDAGKAKIYDISVTYAWNVNSRFENVPLEKLYTPKSNGTESLTLERISILGQYDPENITTPPLRYGTHTKFLKLKQGDFTWWLPHNYEFKPDIEIVSDNRQESNALKFNVKANGAAEKCKISINGRILNNISVPEKSLSPEIDVPIADLSEGGNAIRIEYGDNKFIQQTITNWHIDKEIPNQETVNLASYFNDQVTNIFKNKYLSPRPTSPTLQLPWQGIGDWCYPLVDANIDDSGLRNAAGDKNEFVTPQHLKFATPGKTGEKNILFTSQWDNYPKHAEVPLSGKASHVYLLMAGSTNPMQSRLINGEVVVSYTDGTSEILELKNPQTWWPIEQDYEEDGYAFQLNAARPIRVYLKSGIAATEWSAFKGIKGFSNRGIDGGAATILDMVLNPAKELKSLQVKAVANDVVIGLMGVTLIRE